MISKGLDFDNIELVAFLKQMHCCMFRISRAEERAYQLITQVSGREETLGKVKTYIQTYNPYHPLLN